VTDDTRIVSWVRSVDDLRSGMAEKRIPLSGNVRAPACR